VKNLASTVLALGVKRLAADWQRAYGYRPLLLETYVDQERFRGTCYRPPTGCMSGTRRDAGARIASAARSAR